MIALLYFLLAILILPFKSKSRVEAESLGHRHVARGRSCCVSIVVNETLVAAVGVDVSGDKHPLGLV
jgi:hypothetical protein